MRMRIRIRGSHALFLSVVAWVFAPAGDAASAEPFSGKRLAPAVLSEIAGADLTLPPLHGEGFPEAPMASLAGLMKWQSGLADTGDCVVLRDGLLPDSALWDKTASPLPPKDGWPGIAREGPGATITLVLPYRNLAGAPAWPQVMNISLNAYGNWLVWPLGGDRRSFGFTPLHEAYQKSGDYHNLVSGGALRPDVNGQLKGKVEIPGCRLATVRVLGLWAGLPDGVELQQQRTVALVSGLAIVWDQAWLAAQPPLVKEAGVRCQWGMNFGGTLKHNLGKLACQRMEASSIGYSPSRYSAPEWRATVWAPGTGGPEAAGLQAFWVSPENDDIQWWLIPAPSFGSVPVGEYFSRWYLRDGIPRVTVPRVLKLGAGQRTSAVKVFVAVLEPFKGAGQVSAVGSLVPGNPGALKLTYVDGSTGCLLLERATGRLSFVRWDKKGICRQFRLAEGKELPVAGTVGPTEPDVPISSLVRATEEASVAMDYSQHAFRAYVSAPKDCEAVFASDPVDRLSVDGAEAKADWANGQLKIRLSRGVHVLSAKTLGEGPRIELAGSVKLWKGLPFKSCLE